MKNHRFIFWVNGIFLLLVISTTACTKLLNLPTEGLFFPPSSPQYPTAGLLTYTFQLLCYIPPIVCAFSFALLKKIRPKNQNNNFILSSALLMLGFLINEVYRIHITLVYAGIPKLTTITVYGMIALVYTKAFWKRIKSTPYSLLLASVGLLLIAILIDSLHLTNISSFLEGVPKLFSGINAALYFWIICYKEIILATDDERM
ncbi:hypothetical protein NIES4071_36490 [Calothrix sp. NIES-4071]|nr:hypothetical protein NIES4071_36490 [Calothrix sp. NIES-4071]BAZ57968.1 hypothetical protein NIES4105_36420 [Calothrix sp. NIES-4105]